jgi:hypothetical protein
MAIGQVFGLSFKHISTKGQGNKGNLRGSLMLLDKTTFSRWSSHNKCTLEQCQHYKDNIPTTNNVLGWQSGQGWLLQVTLGGGGIFLDFHGKSLSIHYNGEDGGIEYDGL